MEGSSGRLPDMAKDLDRNEREEIRVGIERGDSDREIARSLQRSPSTVGDEIRRNKGRRRYRATIAENRAVNCRQRLKTTKLEAHPELAEQVQTRIEDEKLSPQVISKQLEAEGGINGVTIGKDSIYRAVYAHGGLGLKDSLYKCLHHRRRRPKRRHHKKLVPGCTKGPLGKFRLISSRPAYISKRIQIGHWEGDLIIGAHSRSAILTLVERATRYALMARLVGNHGADTVLAALIMLYKRIPPMLRRTLTWDRGREMARHTELAQATGLKVYFADPHSPWQRGTNENYNGLVRRWLPKSTDLSVHTQQDLDKITTRINNMPRRIHDWKTAERRYTEALSS